ncbi:MAG TPA: DNA alkylation repair protein [Ignavibacteriaceae bacterium]|nr:DNA alkylation repair protein [Ignavibacteriaceae bacterium]
MKKISMVIQRELKKHQDAKKAAWLQNYIKHDIISIGVGIPQIRLILQEVYKRNKLNELSMPEQKVLLDDLVKHEHTESKLAAIIYVQMFLEKTDVKFQLSLISNWFDKKWISDWNVCDWLCVRLLSPLVDSYPQQTITELKKWNRASYLWKARASLVPLAQCKTLRAHLELVDMFNKSLINREERFCKTAVGWVLREISKFDKKYVMKFLEEHHSHVTLEVKKNATKYFHL